MKHILFFFCLALSVHGSLKAQNTDDFARIDARMSLHYNSAAWDSVIFYGKLGLLDSIDDFYLRYRLAEAYYQKGRYGNAIFHYKQALEFRPAHLKAQEYLYKSYVMAGREDEARVLAIKFSESLREQLGVKKFEPVKNILLLGGATFNNNLDKNSDLSLGGEKVLYGKALLTGNTPFFTLGLTHQLGPRVRIYHSFSYLYQERTSLFQGKNNRFDGRKVNITYASHFIPLPAPGFYTQDTIYSYTSKTILSDTLAIQKSRLNQLQYYIQCNIQLNNGYSVTPSFHLLNVSYSILKAEQRGGIFSVTDSTHIHTQRPQPSPPFIGDTIIKNYTPTTLILEHWEQQMSDTNYFNYSIGLSLNKSFRNGSASLFGSYSNLNGYKQTEAGLGFTFFPRGNLNCYISPAATLFKQKYEKVRFIFDAAVGFKLFSKMWAEINASYGLMHNYSEKNGLIINNHPDYSKYKLGAILTFPFRHLVFNIQYQFRENESYYSKYNYEKKVTYYHFNYFEHNISGGITWKL